MKTVYQKLLGLAVGLTLAVVGAGCGPGGTAALTPTPTGLISEQQAIAVALRSAATSRPEVSGALVTPTAVQAEQLTLAEAVTQINSGADFGTVYNLEMPVWLVTMDGLWTAEGLAPDVTPTMTQTPYRHFAIILDAVTGQEISSSLRP